MKIGLIICLLASSLLLVSCEQFLMEPAPPNNPINNFEQLWRVLDERYAFFDVKRIDWDSVYVVYRPQVNNQMRNQQLFEVCLEMLGTLRDGHVFLRGDGNTARYPFQAPFDPRTLNRENLKNTYLSIETGRADGLLYRIFDNVGYIFYESFTENLSFGELEKVFAEFQFAGVKSVIVDVRGNGGGNPQNAFRLAERFTDVSREVIHSRVKIGPGREDFGEPEVYSIHPAGNYRFSGPVLLLIDGQTFSAANLFVAIMRNLPQVTISGRPSGGGGGLPAVYELPNGWTFSYSASLITLPDGYIIEQGFIPDIFPPIGSVLGLLGRDPFFEFSLNYMRNRFP